MPNIELDSSNIECGGVYLDIYTLVASFHLFPWWCQIVLHGRQIKNLTCISFISGIFTYGIISYDILPGSLWHFYLLHFSSNIFAYGIFSSGIFTAHLKNKLSEKSLSI